MKNCMKNICSSKWANKLIWVSKRINVVELRFSPQLETKFDNNVWNKTLGK